MTRDPESGEVVGAAARTLHVPQTLRNPLTPAPRPWHEVVWGRLFDALREYARAEPVGHVFGSRSDISWGPDTLVSPDIIVVPLAEARTLEWAKMQHLLLVAEVLSPSSGRHDRFAKRRLYQEQQVPLYWVVDGDERVVEVWKPEALYPHVESERLVWHPMGASAPFTLALTELFRPL